MDTFADAVREALPSMWPTPKRLAEAVKTEAKKTVGLPGTPEVYLLPLKEQSMGVVGCRRFSFGKDSTKQNRTIMVLGATGAGKSTLINGMINHILGVQWKDTFRFKLVNEATATSQAHSQTSEVTVYKLSHREGFQIPYSLTIVDTPGFGDTRGIERDKMIVRQLANLFSAQHGVCDIDAICFVAQASLARLTPTQKYVFDSVLSIFGKNVSENIRMLVTFADGQLPPVLAAIQASEVPCPKRKDGLPIYFKFNNSALFARNNVLEVNGQDDDNEDDEDGEGNFDQMFWDMGNKSMKNFFSALTKIETKSLTLTKEVLRQRSHLEVSIDNLQKNVKLGLAKLEEIRQESQILQKHAATITANKDFEYEFTFNKPVQFDISKTNHYITNCARCSTTCHYPCQIPNDADKSGCAAIGPDGQCTECPGKCHWTEHFNQKYRWDYQEVTEKRTYKELKDKYQEATKKKMSIDDVVNQMKKQFNKLEEDVGRLVKRSAECLNTLKAIALKPNPLSTPEYIDLLIEGEKSEAKPGCVQRIAKLQQIREKAVTTGKVASGHNPLSQAPR